MSNMTGLGRYQKGLELEKEGLTGAQIAAKLGYANAQGWYDAKYRYSDRTAAFNARAAETASKTASYVETDPVIAEVPKPTPKLQQKQQFAPAAIPEAYVNPPVDEPAHIPPKLKISIETRAQGEFMEYCLSAQTLFIEWKEKKRALILTREQALVMLEEIKELLKA